jgi:hypothetical protein
VALALLPADDVPAAGLLAAPVAAGLLAAPVVLLLALLHAATSSAAARAPPALAASLVRPDIRLNMEFPIVLVSGLARLPGPAQLRMNDFRYKYGRIVTEDCLLIVQPSVIPVTIRGTRPGSRCRLLPC